VRGRSCAGGYRESSLVFRTIPSGKFFPLAFELRLAKYPENAQRDAKHAEAVAALWQRYWQREEANRAAGRREPALDAFRWLIEELRVSLFAQELRTPFPVSYKRLEKAWKEISAG